MIFISYSRKDSKYVTLLVNICKAQKIQVFIDVHSINFGEKWLPALEKAINEAEKFYLFWSKNASNSEYVKKEIELIKLRENPEIIPIIMDKTPLPDKISEYNGFEYVKNEYDDLRKRERTSRFYKISTFTLLIALIFFSTFSFFGSTESKNFDSPSNMETYKPSLSDYPPATETDSGDSQGAESPASPTIVDDEIVFENHDYYVFSEDLLRGLLLLVLIYLFVNYRIHRNLFNKKVKEFIKHI